MDLNHTIVYMVALRDDAGKLCGGRDIYKIVDKAHYKPA